jgi:two-component system C4-dicarboxylate transport response regulator DctD
VLIQGETGTGKELVARCLHEASARREGNFVAVNCGGLPDTLFDSEMFGTRPAPYRRGQSASARSSTPAAARCSWTRSSMPLPMQIKLLRVLQERVLERLGSNTLTVAAA